jgi:hypothetical protein
VSIRTWLLIVLTVSIFASFNSVTPIHAASFTAIQNGNWDDPATWDATAVPTMDDDVTIPLGITVTIPTITVQRNVLTTVDGALVNNGTFDNYGFVENNGSFDNSGAFNNYCDAIFSGNPVSGNPINNLPCPTSTHTPTDTPTDTVTPTDTDTPTLTLTDTPTDTVAAPTDTDTPIGPLTDTPTLMPTDTLTNTPTNTRTPINTRTPTRTPSPTRTYTPFPTPSNTRTPTNTRTPSLTPTITNTPTITYTPSPFPTCTPIAPIPILLHPIHRTHTTDPTPTFGWEASNFAVSYRLLYLPGKRSP